MRTELFCPVLEERRFAEAVPSLMNSAPAYTSELKLPDNLVMGMGYLGGANESLQTRTKLPNPPGPRLSNLGQQIEIVW